jgi:hypothetical protein
MKIQVAGLSEGLHEFNFTIPPVDLGLSSAYGEPVDVHVHLEKSASQISLTAEVATTGTFQCDRCLTEFQAAISSSYHMH